MKGNPLNWTPVTLDTTALTQTHLNRLKSHQLNLNKLQGKFEQNLQLHCDST